MGPAVKIAFKDGVPGPAAVAFAKKAGVAVEALTTKATPKGEYLAATSVKKGREAAEVIAEEMPKELAGIYWAKNMYWNGARGAPLGWGSRSGLCGRCGGWWRCWARLWFRWSLAGRRRATRHAGIACWQEMRRFQLGFRMST